MNGVKICKTINGLSSINRADTELVIWKRSLAADLQDWIGHTDSDNLPNFRILVDPAELRQALEPLLDKCGLKAEDMRGRLVDDIYCLVLKFAEVTQCDAVDVRLQRISNDACWRFHRDVVKTRLVTTYLGPATEWVQNTYSEQAILKQLEYKGPLEHLGDRDVAIFKGSCTHPNSGIVHRSPPITNTGITRLLLCLNQRTKTSPDPWTETIAH